MESQTRPLTVAQKIRVEYEAAGADPDDELPDFNFEEDDGHNKFKATLASDIRQLHNTVRNSSKQLRAITCIMLFVVVFMVFVMALCVAVIEILRSSSNKAHVVMDHAVDIMKQVNDSSALDTVRTMAFNYETSQKFVIQDLFETAQSAMDTASVYIDMLQDPAIRAVLNDLVSEARNITKMIDNFTKQQNLVFKIPFGN